jgi:hypothetical protein
MNKIFLIIVILAIVGVVAGVVIFFNGPFLSGCKIEETRVTPVPLELAKSVALDHVNKNNKPYEWVYVNSYTVYNSVGDSNYYIFIFRKKEFIEFDTLEKLEQNAKQFSDSTSEESDNKYQFNNIANVMTGTMKEDKLIQSFSRGITEEIGKKLEIEEFVESKYPGKTIGNLIGDTPMGMFYYEIIDKASGKASGDLIKIYDLSIVPRSNLVQYRGEVQEREDRRYSTLSESDCILIQNSILEREDAYRKEWDGFIKTL